MGLVAKKSNKKLSKSELVSIFTHKPKSELNSVSIYNESDKRGKTEHSITYAKNANWWQLTKQKYGYVREQRGGGRRGDVSWFSRSSRFAMMTTLNQIDRQLAQEDKVLFITLTYCDDSGLRVDLDGKEYKRQLELFTKWLERKHPDVFGVWKYELGVERYRKYKEWVGHFHLIVFDIPFYELDAMCKIWNKIVQGNDDHRKIGVDVKRPSQYQMVDRRSEHSKGDWAGIRNYVSANKLTNYMGKNHTAYIDSARAYCKEKRIGRFWGSFGKAKLRKHINKMNIDLDQNQYASMLRVMKRQFLADLRKKGDYKGLVRAKKYMKCWNQPSININRFGGNIALLRLVEWSSNLEVPIEIYFANLVGTIDRKHRKKNVIKTAVDDFYNKSGKKKKKVLDVSNWQLVA